MKAKDIIKLGLARRETTQEELSKKLGYKNQSGVGNIVNRTDIRVETLARVLEILGYEVVVVEKDTKKVLGKITAELPDNIKTPDIDGVGI